jgi:hypothetical protein
MDRLLTKDRCGWWSFCIGVYFDNVVVDGLESTKEIYGVSYSYHTAQSRVLVIIVIGISFISP